MAILAQLEETDRSERRASGRRRLQLAAQGTTSSSPKIQVVIHDLSVSGLLMETFAHFSVGERLELELPQSGAVEAEIVWNSGRYFGCRFIQPISTGAVSAALLLSPGHSPAGDNAQLISIALAELRTLGSQVQHITDRLDEAIDRRRQSDLPGAAAEEAQPAHARTSHRRTARTAAWVAVGGGLIAVAAVYLGMNGDAPASALMAIALALLVSAAVACGFWVEDHVHY